ncbi:hypothetical protein GCM10027345_16820 [Hymenobacter daeguensis]
MRKGPVGADFFYLNGNALRFKHANDNGQAAVAALLAQNQREGARLGLAGRKAQDFKLDFFQGNRGLDVLGRGGRGGWAAAGADEKDVAANKGKSGHLPPNTAPETAKPQKKIGDSASSFLPKTNCPNPQSVHVWY